MSAVISDAAFEREMWCLHMRLGELCHYSQWHKEEPTKPLREMIREMTRIREEAEVEATKRAMEDWAWEEEQEALREEEESLAQIPCEYCFTVQDHDICAACTDTIERYGALRCDFCLASYRGSTTGDWHNPCELCDSEYIADYRYAEEQRVALPPVPESSEEDEEEE